MKIAALYARVSTDNQAKEQTIVSQIRDITERISTDGNILSEKNIYKDDGWSGTNLQRPELDRMRGNASKGEFEVLYVYDRGRIARKFAYQELIIDELTEKKVEVITLHDFEAKTPEDHVMQAMQGVFHEYERVKITERMRLGKLNKAKDGKIVHGSGDFGPYGYRYILRTKNAPGYYEIIPEEAENVRKAYQYLGIDGMTIRQVIKKFHEEGVQPRKSTKGTWNTSTLSRLFRDESYIGITYYRKGYAVEPTNPTNHDVYKKVKKSSRKLRPKSEWIPIAIPPIIDEAIFMKAQNQLKLNSEFSMRNKKNQYLLSGKLYCICGCKRNGEGNSHTGHLYYRCIDRVLKYPLPPTCDSKGVNSTVLDNMTWDHVERLLTDPSLIEQQAKRWQSSRQQKQESYTSNKETTRLDLCNALRNLEEEEKRYIHLYGEKLISDDQLRDCLQKVRLKKADIQTKLNQQQASSDSIQPITQLPDLPVLCDKMKVILKGLLFTEKQMVVRKLVQKVITDGKTATVQGYVPLNAPSENLGVNEYVGLWSQGRHRRASQRRQKHAV